MSMGGGGPAADDVSRIAGVGAQEVFVFDFGAAVFWGFSRGEETNLLKTIRMFVTKGFVGAQEFQSGEDDMAFVTMPDAEGITIANDVITLPDDSPAKQRMSVSFAIAQSTVLAIFESRVERKVEDYRYIPEALAASGKVHLTERQLGTMIGTYMWGAQRWFLFFFSSCNCPSLPFASRRSLCDPSRREFAHGNFGHT
jgi:uncharacterized Rmd1/YagE family protein